MNNLPGRREALTRITLGAATLQSIMFAADVVSVGMIPDAGATQVSMEQKAPLKAYLSRALGAEVNLIIPTNYNATVEALGNGSLDFAYLGALTYVKAHERYGVVPLVQRAVDKQFHSLFITQTGSAIKTLADCKGKSFAFGDINSTSGHLIPYSELKNAGVNAEQDLKFRYTGSHPATAKAVESGAADAGALDETVYKSLIADGTLSSAKMRVFHTSAPFVDYVWVARKTVTAAKQKKFAAAFTSLKEGKDDAVLKILRGKDFVMVRDSDYESIRKLARELKLL